VRYAQRQRKSGFVNNMTTVLPASGHAGLHVDTFDTFSGSPELSSRPLSEAKTPKMARPPHDSG
jgi:hypothetical protein